MSKRDEEDERIESEEDIEEGIRLMTSTSLVLLIDKENIIAIFRFKCVGF